MSKEEEKRRRAKAWRNIEKKPQLISLVDFLRKYYSPEDRDHMMKSMSGYFIDLGETEFKDCFFMHGDTVLINEILFWKCCMVINFEEKGRIRISQTHPSKKDPEELITIDKYIVKNHAANPGPAFLHIIGIYATFRDNYFFECFLLSDDDEILIDERMFKERAGNMFRFFDDDELQTLKEAIGKHYRQKGY